MHADPIKSALVAKNKDSGRLVPGFQTLRHNRDAAIYITKRHVHYNHARLNRLASQVHVAGAGKQRYDVTCAPRKEPVRPDSRLYYYVVDIIISTCQRSENNGCQQFVMHAGKYSADCTSCSHGSAVQPR